jgi:hypothetical protein
MGMAKVEQVSMPDPLRFANLQDFICAFTNALETQGLPSKICIVNNDSGTGPWYSSKVVKNGDVGLPTIIATLEFFMRDYRKAQENGTIEAWARRWAFIFYA